MAVVATRASSVFHLMCFETLVFFPDEDAASCSVFQVKILSLYRRYRAALQHRRARCSRSSWGAQKQLRRGVSNTNPSNCCGKPSSQPSVEHEQPQSFCPARTQHPCCGAPGAQRRLWVSFSAQPSPAYRIAGGVRKNGHVGLRSG